jgi:hypothetical protein
MMQNPQLVRCEKCKWVGKLVDLIVDEPHDDIGFLYYKCPNCDSNNVFSLVSCLTRSKQ